MRPTESRTNFAGGELTACEWIGQSHVVQVEDRQRRDEILVRVEERLDRPDIPPVVAIAIGGPGNVVALHVVDARLAAADEVGDDVAAHVVVRRGQLAVGLDRFDERVRVEDVVAHRGEHLVRASRQSPVGFCGFSRNSLILARVAGVDVDDAELVRERDRLADAGDRRAGTRFDVGGQHLTEVHAVHVIGADHDDDVGLLVVDEVEALQDRVGGAREPALAEALLRGHRGDVRVEQRRHAPRLRDVAVEAVRLVLGQHDDLAKPRVDEVRDREVDEPVLPAERDCGLRPVRRQGHQSLSLAAGEDDSEDLRRCWHGTTL